MANERTRYDETMTQSLAGNGTLVSMMAMLRRREYERERKRAYRAHRKLAGVRNDGHGIRPIR